MHLKMTDGRLKRKQQVYDVVDKWDRHIKGKCRQFFRLNHSPPRERESDIAFWGGSKIAQPCTVNIFGK